MNSQDNLEFSFAEKTPVIETKNSEHEVGTLHLVDASGYIFRAYHALPSMTNSQGTPTHAVLGFTRMIMKLIREQAPTHWALCFDKESRKGRLAIDPNYKAHREAPPEDLISQFELIRRVALALNIPVFEYAGWEADDVIATLALKAQARGWKVRILASDKDFVQLLSGSIELFDPVQEKRIGPEEATAKYGIQPSQMRDYLALIGDASDNVAKVPGIGPKTAVELLHQFRDVETLIAHIAEVKKPKIREALASNVDTLRLAKTLVTFKTDLPLDFEPAQFTKKDMHVNEARALFAELEFSKLLQELPQAVPTILEYKVQVVDDAESLKKLVTELSSLSSITLELCQSGEGFRDSCAGMALASDEGHLFYVPWGHAAGPQLPREGVLSSLREVLEDSNVRKLTYDGKTLTRFLNTSEISLAGVVVDIELLSHLVHSARRQHALTDLAREGLGVELPALYEGARLGKMTVESASIKDAANAFGAAVDSIRRISHDLSAKVDEMGLRQVTYEIELPLIPILAHMEQRGILVDLSVLDATRIKVDLACEERLKEVYRLAGTEFNVGSPAQLAKILFSELKLPVLKKGKTGPSTDQEVLEKLSEMHPLPHAIIEYRNVAKLKSTYLDTLPLLIEKDGRIHTTLHQLGAATGRLSSSNPNLQNIPIRTELGKEIRRAFVAQPKHVLLSADYSQLELRILAHMAGDASLLEAFAHDEDVHSRTAAEVYGVGVSQVTPEMRRAAKMVNYGIAYGLSAHGLATRLNIEPAEAKSIIEKYFERYQGIQRYLEATVEQAKKLGYVETLFGRKRYMPELTSKNRHVAMAAERAAINMPIQGLAADLIKRAMLKIDRQLKESKVAAHMLLQVHDELLFEVPDGDVERVKQLAIDAMSYAPELRVPLRIDVGVGHSWAEAH